MEENDIRRALNREYAPKPDVKAEWERLGNRLDIEQESAQMVSIGRNRRMMAASFFTGIAATLATLYVISILTRQPDSEIRYAFTAIEQPSEVMLTTADGETHPVAKGNEIMPQKAKSGNNALASSKMCTLTTPRGKDFQLSLADGTTVWMNADTRLDFPEAFSGKSRIVRLKGEAFFEVAKDEKHPFIVETDYFNATVLGTSFNIRAYNERSAAVVLVDGSVEMEAGVIRQMLKPGEMATFNTQLSTFNCKEVDTYPYTQWRDGFFYFNDASLFEIMQELGRWYNINIAFDNPAKMNLHLHFVAQRSSSIREAISNLNALGVVQIDYENGVVTIK